MLKRMLMTMAVGLATMATGALAADCSSKQALGITAAGAAIDSSGTADKRAVGDHQRFKVGMDARVPAGTTYTVHVNGGVDPVGTIVFDIFGNGQFTVNNEEGAALPAAVNPVCSVSWVEVKSGPTVLLSGAL